MYIYPCNADQCLMNMHFCICIHANSSLQYYYEHASNASEAVAPVGDIKDKLMKPQYFFKRKVLLIFKSKWHFLKLPFI